MAGKHLLPTRVSLPRTVHLCMVPRKHSVDSNLEDVMVLEVSSVVEIGGNRALVHIEVAGKVISQRKAPPHLHPLGHLDMGFGLLSIFEVGYRPEVKAVVEEVV